MDTVDLVMLHCWVKKSKFLFGLRDPEDEALQAFETSGTTHPMTQHHIPEEFNLQKHTVRTSNLTI
jgi:hypothetical protein